MQVARSWSDEEWLAAEKRLSLRGLHRDGELTDEGRAVRERIERTTDDLSVGPWHRLGEVLATGGVPLFNPIGLPIGDMG